MASLPFEGYIARKDRNQCEAPTQHSSILIDIECYLQQDGRTNERREMVITENIVKEVHMQGTEERGARNCPLQGYGISTIKAQAMDKRITPLSNRIKTHVQGPLVILALFWYYHHSATRCHRRRAASRSHLQRQKWAGS